MIIKSIKYEDVFAFLSRKEERKVIYLLLIFPLIFTGCIEPFLANIRGETKVISIEGSFIKGDSIQQVSISTTSTLLNPQFSPIRNCNVKVIDELENEFTFIENTKGTYSLAVPDDQIVQNRHYRLMITTPDGKVYESDYEKLNSNAPVDTIYFQEEERIESYTGERVNGIQFYTDIVAPDTFSRYFRWNLTETYEYTSTGYISYIYRVVDNVLERYVPPDKWEVYRCWVTEEAPGIYLSNTVNLTVNQKKRIQLNYVSNQSDRLKIKYSLLVSQYTMNEGAYNYWRLNKIAIEESGGLYTSQPARPITNLRCVDDSDQEVLGYFWASSRTEKRIFVPRINSMVVYDFPCPIYEFDPMVHKSLPRYIRVDEFTGLEMTGHPMCFDCTLRGGMITKPDYWQ